MIEFSSGQLPSLQRPSLTQLVWVPTFRFRPMETLDPLLLSMVTLGFAFTLTVFFVAFRQVDRSEKERAQLTRMRGRLNRLLQHRS